jgi:enoyl-[acyl-carrier-protein] reductase (NADH)
MTIGILQRRIIEAEFAKAILEEFGAELGEARAREILSRAVVKLAKQAAATFAADADPAKSPIENFAAIQHHWTKDDALSIEVIAKTDTTFDFNVTRCRYAETYRAMGIGHLSAVLSCNRDGAFCEGFHKDLKLTRTQTIAGGAPFCDFRYRLEAEPVSAASAAPPR